MKYFLSVFLAFIVTETWAVNTACTSFNTQTRIAREAVKSLVNLASITGIESYYGGVESNQDGLMTISVQPHFNNSKDWYRVVIRNSDCRVLNVNLVAENMPLQ